MSDRRVVCLNCIDGRVQLPVIYWIKDSYPADHVDMITEPGMDGLLADQANQIDTIVEKVRISLDKNKSEALYVVGHFDCKGNPVSDEEHQTQVESAVLRLKEVFPEKTVQGLWVDQGWSVNPL